ncbi:hypothetical protein [Paenibacillus timonensis]|uniref:hypothetical protein n=1 Tax=Paenibacillus timonensis TaxID=225915 RepID=UPI003F9D04BA
MLYLFLNKAREGISQPGAGEAHGGMQCEREAAGPADPSVNSAAARSNADEKRYIGKFGGN